MSVQEHQREPTTAEILTEVEHRRAAKQQPRSERSRRIIILVDRAVFWLTKHWLALANGFVLFYVGLPILAPILMALGVEQLGRAIHFAYRPLCHQLPQRSFFLFGPQLSYSVAELLEQVGLQAVDLRTARTFIGNADLGYKMALCQRDVAIYGSILLAGLAFILVRRRLRPLPFWGYALCMLPMALDGGYQMFSALIPYVFPRWPIVPYESTPLLRVITGGAFGLGTVWLAYPLLQETMDEFRQSLNERFGWE